MILKSRFIIFLTSQNNTIQNAIPTFFSKHFHVTWRNIDSGRFSYFEAFWGNATHNPPGTKSPQAQNPPAHNPPRTKGPRHNIPPNEKHTKSPQDNIPQAQYPPRWKTHNIPPVQNTPGTISPQMGNTQFLANLNNFDIFCFLNVTISI